MLPTHDAYTHVNVVCGALMKRVVGMLGGFTFIEKTTKRQCVCERIYGNIILLFDMFAVRNHFDLIDSFTFYSCSSFELLEFIDGNTEFGAAE